MQISGIYMEENAARAGFYKSLLNSFRTDFKWDDHNAKLKNYCECEDCKTFYNEEQERMIPIYKKNRIEDAQREFDHAVREKSNPPTEEEERNVQDLADELECATECEYRVDDFYGEWLGRSDEELIQAALAGESDAWRFFHVYGVKDDGNGGLRYIEETFDEGIASETCMKRVPVT